MNQHLLKRLQVIIEDMSVNSLTSIYPEQMVELLEAPRGDVKQLVDDMFLERMLAYKYRIQCQCGNVCTAYLRKLQREPYVCKECNREYKLDYVKQKGTLLYELDKKEILNFGNETINFKQESLQSTKVVYLENAQIKSREDSIPMEIFLGSSSEAVDDMVKIGYQLEQLGKTALPWNIAGKGIFPPNQNTIDSLIDITKRVQAAVFIFNADDMIWHHNSLKESKKVRDNVLFEYGLFCGALGKEKVCFVCKGNPSLASDLNGVTYINGDEKDITIRMKLQDWLNAM